MYTEQSARPSQPVSDQMDIDNDSDEEDIIIYFKNTQNSFLHWVANYVRGWWLVESCQLYAYDNTSLLNFL